MKAIYLYLLPALLATAACDPALVNADPDDHAETVEHSRTHGTVVISLDTIFDSGVPYATIKSAPVILPGRIGGAGSNLYSLSGARLLRIVPIRLYNADYLAFAFDDGRYSDTAFLPYRQDLRADAETLVQQRMMLPDSLDQRRVKEFVAANGRPPYRAPQPGDLVIREKSQFLYHRLGEIWQSGVMIGRYDSTAMVVSGIPCAYLTVYHIDSTICATVTYGVTPPDSSASMVTRRDRKFHEVKRSKDRNLFETTLWSLVRQSYL